MKYATIGIALLAVVLAGLALGKPSVIEQVVGSASSPSVVDGCMEVNGVTTCSYSQGMKLASTTCSFKAPALASSTLISASASWTDLAGGGYSAEWGKAFNSAFATSTTLGNLNTLATASGDYYFSASTTAATQNEASTNFATTDYLNLKLGSTSPSALTLRGGKCTAVFRVQ